MTFKIAVLAPILSVLLASGAHAQTPVEQTPNAPDFRVQIWGVAAPDFDARMLYYAELRAHLQDGLTFPGSDFAQESEGSDAMSFPVHR